MSEQKEKRLSVKLVGHDFVTAWENKDKEPGSKQPDYKGDGVAVWVHEVDDSKKPIPEDNAVNKL